MSLRKIPLHWKIILGMFFGVLFGFLMSNFDQTGKDLMGWLDSMLQWEYISLGWNGEAVHSIFSDRDFFTMEEMFQPLQEITGKQSGFQEVR